METKTKENATNRGARLSPSGARRLDAVSQGHQGDNNDLTTGSAQPAPPRSANYLPGLILQLARQFQQHNHCQKQGLLEGRHTYCFPGSGPGARIHKSSSAEGASLAASIGSTNYVVS